MRKDVSLAQDFAASLGVRLPVAAAASDMLEEALRNGLADADIASVMSLLDRTTSRTPVTTTSDDITEEP